MRRFTAKTVFFGLVRACRLAIWPTRRSPLAVKPTIDGVVRAPSWFGMTWGAPPSITATQELVVPRSMPITLPTPHLAALVASPERAQALSVDLHRSHARVLGHLHQRGAQEPVPVGIALAVHLDHRALREPRRRLVGQGLVALGVEGLAQRALHRHPLRLQDGEQLPSRELDALPHRGVADPRLQGAVEVVVVWHQVL